MNELNLMKYKDYFTRVYVDMEEHTLFGRLEGITDLEIGRASCRERV